jgi:hypothetical protein
MVDTMWLETKQVLGLLLVGMGLLLFCFVLIDVAPYGPAAGLVSSWVVVILICSGIFLWLNVHVRDSLPSIVAVLMALIILSLIFLVPLPGNLQILLAPAVGLVSLLLYRFFKARKSSRSSSWTKSALRY